MGLCWIGLCLCWGCVEGLRLTGLGLCCGCVECLRVTALGLRWRCVEDLRLCMFCCCNIAAIATATGSAARIRHCLTKFKKKELQLKIKLN